MLVGRLPLQRGSIAGCCIGVAKSMCSVMLQNGDNHISYGKSEWVRSIINQLIITSMCYQDCLQPQNLRAEDFRSYSAFSLILQVQGLQHEGRTICWMYKSGSHPRTKAAVLGLESWALNSVILPIYSSCLLSMRHDVWFAHCFWLLFLTGEVWNQGFLLGFLFSGYR